MASPVDYIAAVEERLDASALLSQEQLDAHAFALATSHVVRADRRRRCPASLDPRGSTSPSSRSWPKGPARAFHACAPSFVVEVLHWLRDQPFSAAPAWFALQDALEGQGESAEEVFPAEQQRESADQVAIGNVITSMRLLSAIDWPLFFDRVSIVEQILWDDPAGAYGDMDFPTRESPSSSATRNSRRSSSTISWI